MRISVPCLICFLLMGQVGCHEDETRGTPVGNPEFILLNPIPNGEKILYDYSPRFGGTTTVRSMRTDGSGVVDIMSIHAVLEGNPVPSPDGDKIVFHISDPSSDGEIQDDNGIHHFNLALSYMLVLDGVEVVQLTGTREKNIQDSASDWSPDGRTIFFTHSGDRRVVAGEGILTGPVEIWAIDSDGLNPRRITGGRASSIAPNGKTLSFSDFDENGEHTFFIDTDGSNRRSIRRGAYGCRWRPNGIHLACLDLRSRGLILINTEGELLSEITHGFFVNQANHTWSPDGTWIAFSADLEDENQDSIWKVSVDGSSVPIRLTPKGEDSGDPYWSR